MEKLERRVIELTDYLCERAPSAGLEVFSSRASGEKSGIVSLVKPGVSPDAIEETFERGVLPLALQARGIQVLHASGIETPQGVVAFCARSQTGKSTLAYACSRAWGFPHIRA